MLLNVPVKTSSPDQPELPYGWIKLYPCLWPEADATDVGFDFSGFICLGICEDFAFCAAVTYWTRCE